MKRKQLSKGHELGLQRRTSQDEAMKQGGTYKLETAEGGTSLVSSLERPPKKSLNT